MPFLVVCMNPTLQRTLCFSAIKPGLVNRTSDYYFDVSGKGVNAARVFAQLGEKVIHLTHLGGEFRGVFLDMCEKDGIEVHWVESESQIRFCYTLLEEESRAVTELVEEGKPVARGTEGRLLAKYAELLPSCGTVVILGTKAGGYSGELVPEMSRLARENGKTLILDLRGDDLAHSLPHRPAVVKPNLFEFAGTFIPGLKPLGDLSGDEDGVFELVKKTAFDLCLKYGVKIILTRGASSVWCYELSAEGLPIFSEYPVEAVPRPVNTTGSGDAFTAGLASALAGGFSFAEAVRRGIHCGALNAGLLRPGVIQ